MRLNDKLIRKNCPSCRGEITLETSALDKKINCPKCRQTVIISEDRRAAPSKPSSKKSVPKEKRDRDPAQAEKSPVAQELPRIFIQRIDDVAQTPAPEGFDGPVHDKKAVVYCICRGILKKCQDGSACCVKTESCVYADEVTL